MSEPAIPSLFVPLPSPDGLRSVALSSSNPTTAASPGGATASFAETLKGAADAISVRPPGPDPGSALGVTAPLERSPGIGEPLLTVSNRQWLAGSNTPLGGNVLPESGLEKLDAGAFIVTASDHESAGALIDPAQPSAPTITSPNAESTSADTNVSPLSPAPDAPPALAILGATTERPSDVGQSAARAPQSIAIPNDAEAAPNNSSRLGSANTPYGRYDAAGNTSTELAVDANRGQSESLTHRETASAASFSRLANAPVGPDQGVSLDPSHGLPNTARAVSESTSSNLELARPLQPSGDAQRWANGLGDRMIMLAENGTQSARLRLHPEHLGTLDVRISVDDDAAQVWFGTQNAQTREALEAALPRLRELFADQGLKLLDANIGERHEGDRDPSATSDRSPTTSDRVADIDEPAPPMQPVETGLPQLIDVTV